MSIDEGGSPGLIDVIFDSGQQPVSATKDILGMTPARIAFREYPKGTIPVHFTHLLSHQNALREIRYSVDDESLSQKLAFKADRPGPGAPGIGEEDQVYTEIPMSTQFVCVKRFYMDGRESAVKKFPTSRPGTPIR